jgi:threonyl-tRNA synthetase
MDKLEAMRHTAAHLLAAAVKDLWPGTHNAIGPAITEGFYQDFDLGDRVISESDFPKIEKRMYRLLKNWGEFDERIVSAEEARKLFAENPYKLELIEELAAANKQLTVNDPGNFLDLCRGGHMEKPNKELRAFKLLSVAGAYWRGDEKNKMLTRIYGTAFATQEELEEFLERREEAKKRDHRKLGKELDLFVFSPLVGAGLPLFTPKGTVIREELSRWLWELQGVQGYQKTDIPHLAKPELYKISGHWDKFGDSLFHVRGKGDEEFVVKPMNCPHHTQIFAARPRSYRDLPMKLAEITKVYRDEQAGELLGLARVRSITQDDAHVFCAKENMRQEIATAMGIIRDFYRPFNFELKIRLSLSDPATPDAYLGTREIWEEAENSLRGALKAQDAEFVEESGEAAFYGPKIDYTAIDSLKREWQLATVQLDLNMPERFGLKYTNAAGAEETPIMIHRAISGAQERFIAILLEHYAGALPLWLSPTQVKILPIADDQIGYATKIREHLEAAGVRVEIDERSESIGKKIREAQLMKTPIMLIIGKKEEAEGVVAVRTREEGDRGTQTVEALLEELRTAVEQRR